MHETNQLTSRAAEIKANEVYKEHVLNALHTALKHKVNNQEYLYRTKRCSKLKALVRTEQDYLTEEKVCFVHLIRLGYFSLLVFILDFIEVFF